MPDDMQQANEFDLRETALHLAHHPNEAPSQVIRRAGEYLAFLKGEVSIPATGNE